MPDDYAEAFQTVLEEARKISGISDIERSDFYEPLKARIYELLRDGKTDLGKSPTRLCPGFGRTFKSTSQ
jgi:hypothetical protein